MSDIILLLEKITALEDRLLHVEEFLTAGSTKDKK